MEPELVDFARSIIEDMENRGCVIDWKQASYVVKLPDPGESGRKLTLFVVTKDGMVYIGWLAQQLSALGLPEQISFDFARHSAQLFGEAPTDYWSSNVELKKVQQRYSDFARLVQETIDSIRNASDEIKEKGA
ncbi:hypothetical protein FJZ31_42750 [Candidatus Poribacteria bacterium]|nr:hypothetical protein [Candidatus Poribacteria bacterium]